MDIKKLLKEISSAENLKWELHNTSSFQSKMHEYRKAIKRD